MSERLQLLYLLIVILIVWILGASVVSMLME